MKRKPKLVRRLWVLIAMSLLLGLNPGCVRIAANLVHAFKGNDVPAEFNGLEGKRVAVICSTDDGVSSDANGILLATYVRTLLEQKIEKIDVVSSDEIDKWIDSESRSSSDFTEIGKGLQADYVIAIDMLNLKLKNGATLHRGSSDLSVTVYDIHKSNKNVVFRRTISQFAFPSMGTPTTDTDDATFRRIYLTKAAHRVARHFFPYEMGADVASDAAMLSY